MTELQPPINTSPYIGRFAPSPTGSLHLGSLVAALGSYLQARSQQGRWLLRIEDIDPPREAAGATHYILKTLEIYGFEWDGAITYQSQRQAYYKEALSQLRKNNHIYACHCSRKMIASANTHGKPQHYPGTCRDKNLLHSQSTTAHSLRLRTEDVPIRFTDRVQGMVEHNIYQQSGDFVLFRRDGFYAYVLAVSIDDMQQGITEVVRGSDLLDTTASQICLMQQLGGTAPRYAHLPIVTNAAGEKLSKQTGARALPLEHPVPVLCQALTFLKQSPPADLANATLDEFWIWAQQNWQLKHLSVTANDISTLSV